MAKNSRQKRTAKRKLALALLANVRNPSPSMVRYGSDGLTMVVTKPHEGRVRAAWDKTMPSGSARIPFHGRPAPVSHAKARWSLDGYPKK